MPRTESPLRYPGGKTKLYTKIYPVIENNTLKDRCIYIEPFAGGAGLALKLLYSGDVQQIILNDLDNNIFSFWHSCLTSAEELCDLIAKCEVNLDTWNRQRYVYLNAENYSEMERGFATFFLNRCNVSGIINGGPIGGKNQKGQYKLDARFNKKESINKIMKIYQNRNNIRFYNMDALEFLNNIVEQFDINNVLLNIDPPYVNKGPRLYKNSYTQADHTALAAKIQRLPHKWIVTYDECNLIYDLYSLYRKEIITLNYSMGGAKSGKELMIYGDSIRL